MNRRRFVGRCAALLPAVATMGAVRPESTEADPDVPFTSTNGAGERMVRADEIGRHDWTDAVFRLADSGEEVERVWALNWDAPYIDYYADGNWGEMERVPLAFIVEKGGKVYRSARP